MEAFLSSLSAVSIAEIGDKTQLLSLFLATRFTNKCAIILGIFVATLLNHAASAWLGAWAVQFIPSAWLAWIVGGSFIAVALWLLVPDKQEDSESGFMQYGAFVASTLLFFLAEIGDKTQVATVILAASWPDALALIILGTTLGMLIANVPVVLAGNWLMQRIPLNAARYTACAVFVVIGVTMIVAN